MKKQMLAAIALGVSVILAASSSAAQAAETDKDVHYVTSHVRLVDVATGDVLYEESEIVPISGNGTTTISSPELNTSGQIQPLSTVGGIVQPGSVKSSITLTYTKRTEDVRLERATGSWTPNASIELRNRHVRIINGGIVPATIDKYPTGNSYNYSTGWGFVQYTNSTNYVPRVYAEVQHRIAGTNGSWVKLEQWVDLTNV